MCIYYDGYIVFVFLFFISLVISNFVSLLEFDFGFVLNYLLKRFLNSWGFMLQIGARGLNLGHILTCFYQCFVMEYSF